MVNAIGSSRRLSAQIQSSSIHSEFSGMERDKCYIYLQSGVGQVVLMVKKVDQSTRLSGSDTLKRIMSEHSTPVLMLSANSEEDATATVRCPEGCVDLFPSCLVLFLMTLEGSTTSP
jgi:chemotaxis response regulator CheB